LLLKAVLRLACAVLIIGHPAHAAERGSRAISLVEALQRALAANPRLTAAERDIGVAGGLRIQDGALPNPEASFELDIVLGSGPRASARRRPICSSVNSSSWAESERHASRRVRPASAPPSAATGDATGGPLRDCDRLHYHCSRAARGA